VAAEPPLTGIRVLDIATLFAGPVAATLLADFGADVVKVEHPSGDPLRTHGHVKEGHGLWWKVMSRNKWTVTIDLSTADGQELLRGLARDADVVVENFRPGVLERWGLGYDRLSADNPGLVMLRTTGFGQFGPYAGRRGFGTLAESMSGFAALTGEPDGPPTLPPGALADGIAGISGAYAVMLALYGRDARGGRGQVIDLAIIEPILTVLGAQPTTYDQLGIVMRRTGNRSPNTAPRNAYRAGDGRWVAISASTTQIAERVLRLVGRPDLVEQPWFPSGVERARHAEELDAAIGAWIGERGTDEVLRGFEEAGAAIAPINDSRDVLEDPQYRALGSIVTLEDEDLGPLRIQNVLFRLLDTPGRVRFAGRRLGQDTRRVLGERLGLSEERLDELARAGVI
jgi:crotonobetainyl-CoA:carnitine CoA-transferase CaiB-like acyl-CoA transferase